MSYILLDEYRSTREHVVEKKLLKTSDLARPVLFHSLPVIAP